MEKTFTVDESVGAVNVCVSLTYPVFDILDETVNVFVIDDPSSMYIPPGSPLASECKKCVGLTIFPHVQLLMNQPFSVSTQW